MYEVDGTSYRYNLSLNVFKAPLKCWEQQIRQKFDGKISIKLYHNVKEDVI